MFAKIRCTKNAGSPPKMDEIKKFLRIMFINVNSTKVFPLGFEDRPQKSTAYPYLGGSAEAHRYHICNLSLN